MSKAPETDPAQDSPDVRPPKRRAVGVPAVVNSLRVVGTQAGVKRGLPLLRDVNQTGGFDCPGCAWPEPGHRHPAEFCENGAKAVAEEGTRRRVDPAFFAEHPIADLADKSGYWLGQQGRLTEPVHLPEGATHYRAITWDDAYELIASELAALDHPDQAAFYTSGRTSNEAAFLYQLFARKLGTNNLPDCSNMCHESSGAALAETIGIGKGSVTLDDLHQADLIIVAGQNPGTNHPRMLTALEQAKRAGARIATVNPLPETGMRRFKNPQTARGLAGRGTELTDLFLQIKVGGDLALFSVLNRMLLRASATDPAAIDRDFIADYTNGFDAFAAHHGIDDPDGDAAALAEAVERTGLAADEIERLLAMVLEADRIVVCWAMGLTQHRHAVPTIREVVAFLLLRGNIGRPGAGVCPVRGHSNVQGDRTMGIWERMPDRFLDALGTEFDFAPPRDHGLDTVGTIRAMRDGRVRVFFAMGGNFVAATPDTAATEAAMRGCRLTVHVSTKLNRSHVVTGARALILPALGRTDVDAPGGREQFVTVEDSMGIVHSSRGSVPALSPEMRSEVAIVAGLARAVLGPGDPVPWEEFAGEYDLVRDRIERVVPGFADYNARARVPGGFALPHAPRDAREFPTATGKANFTVNPVTSPEAGPGRLLLQTLRSHDQFNTTIYGLDDRYRGIHDGRRVVLVNPEDAAELGLVDGAYCDLVSEWADGDRRAPHFRIVHYPTARGCAAAYFPETNVLVPLDSVAETSNTPTSKSIVVRFEADSGGPAKT
ncbi:MULTISPECIES: FdhF/YdeP family oxidoreductase [Glycomyces]|uniref:FdhF/YdeP family oxidoreductase n=2 Tax=Glycomyces TaxID=58113 RepID=A0A9X3PGP3_9ACTN|nr:FdhF/YdeP family oxidoreductase [Glycomyces lechevalierae]MDA1385161.1 FdhF/YdeP family oxidoreductase [Glycomyces lechevalierae]MDR7337223.1 molybdopterin-dependent oxidoreductase alpha subunit [Glycomyces lechevalierae]